MEKILENLILAPKLPTDLKGLATIPAPTGFGKTFKTCEFIASHLDEILKKKLQIIFITPLLKNLPVEELRKAFERAGQLHRFDECFLLLKGITDTILNNLLDVQHEIPNELKNKAFKLLVSHIEFLKKDGDKHQALDSKLLSRYGLKDVFSQNEGEFREEIKNFLYEKGLDKKQKLKRLLRPENQWVKKLYPSFEFDHKPIVMMSVKKFVLPFMSLVETSKPLVEMLKPGTIVMMDEFDACKQTIQQTIIESGLKYTFDPLKLVTQTHNHLHQQEPSHGFLKDSALRKKQQSERNWKTTECYYQQLKARLNQVVTQFNLQYNLKNHTVLSTRNFLFHDFTSFQLSNKVTGIVVDVENRMNHLKVLNAPEDNAPKLSHLMAVLQSVLHYLRRNITYSARNYLENKNQAREPAMDEMLLDHALKTVLNEFGVPPSSGFYKRFFDASLQYEYNLMFKKADFEGLRSFYDLGFSYSLLEDSPEHDTYTAVKHYVFFDTPESYLVYLCDKARVVGLSATADMQTPLTNFDLNYLKSKLGKHFLTLSHQEVKRLKREFDESINGYKNVNIDVAFLPGLVNFKEDLARLVGCTEFAVELMDALTENLNLNSAQDNYALQRYLNLFRCLVEFVNNVEIYAYLGLFSALAKPNNTRFNSKLIERFFNAYVQENAHAENVALHILTGDDYDAKFKAIQQMLSSGKRVFVLSAYPTVGAGQNMQYPISANRKTVVINSREASQKMDFNAIYLDTITSIIPNPGGSYYTEEAMVERVFKLEALAEVGDISHAEKMTQIKYSFTGFCADEHPHQTNTYPAQKRVSLTKLPSHYNAQASTLIQAIGRICRTNQKAKTIHIRLNEDFKAILAKITLPESMPLLPEFKAVLAQCDMSPATNTSLAQSLRIKAENHNFQGYKVIKRLLNNIHNPFNIKRWQDLRELCLSNPCFEKITDMSDYIEAAYIQLPQSQDQYWYERFDEDYKKVTISFHNQNKMVSSAEINQPLQRFMQVSGLKEYFIHKGWRTELTSSHYWLTPIMLNTIYKGALGEEIGRYIFEQKLGVNLNPLPDDIYETFDFVLDNGVYIDFKFWINYPIEAHFYKAKILEKLKKYKVKPFW